MLPIGSRRPVTAPPVMTGAAILVIAVGWIATLMWPASSVVQVDGSELEIDGSLSAQLWFGLVPCELISGSVLGPDEIAALALNAPDPACPAEPRSGPVSGKPTPWLGLITSVAVHASWVHVIGNCWFLWVFGRVVEDGTGPVRSGSLLLLGAIFGGFAHVLADPESLRPLVGASAGVAALMSAGLVWYPDSPVRVALLPFSVDDVGLRWFVGSWVLFQVGLWLIGSGAVTAHLAGAITGLLLGSGLKWAGMVERRAFDPRVGRGGTW